MKKIIFLMLVSVCISYSQNKENTISGRKFDLAAGMGVRGIALADVVDYINLYHPVSKENGISVAPEFYVAPEFEISDDLGLKLEYAYLIKSYERSTAYGSLDLTVTINSPALILHYLIKGNGYYFKLGGGLGYRFGSVSQKSLDGEYFSQGAGLRIDVSGHTTLGGNLYAVIGANLSADFMSDLKNDKDIKFGIEGKSVNLGSVGAGLSFGLSYYF